MPVVEGLFVPLVTPFTDDGHSISEVRIAKMLRFWLPHNPQGFYLCGDAGEFLVLSSSERKSVLELVQRDCQGAVPIIVNVSSLSTAKSIDLAQHAHRHGARGVFVTPPYFGRYPDVEVVSHVRSVATFANVVTVVGDPSDMLATPLAEAVWQVPLVQRATMTHWDEWRTENTETSVIRALAVMLERPVSESMIKLVDERGPSPVLKAAYEAKGLDLGGPRSPKLTLLATELENMIDRAA